MRSFLAGMATQGHFSNMAAVTRGVRFMDRLTNLLGQQEALYGVICRDVTQVDIELMAHAGYHVVWLDLEHSHQSDEEAIRLCRTVTHLGMVPLVRIPELTRTHVQKLLDGGVEIVALPDVRNAAQAEELVQLGKYPPVGRRGISSSTPRTGFTLGADPEERLQEVNDATHLMVLFESNEAYEDVDAILGVDGIDMVSVGPNDWTASLGLFGDAAEEYLTPRIDKLIGLAVRAGKTVVMGVSTPERARRYQDLGARLFLIGGTDIAIKRRALADTIAPFVSLAQA